MLRLEKVASPPTAATVVVPERVPPAGFVPIATVTLPVKPGTLLLMASSAATSTGGATCAPAVAVVGRTGVVWGVGVEGGVWSGRVEAPGRPVASAGRVEPV